MFLFSSARCQITKVRVVCIELSVSHDLSAPFIVVTDISTSLHFCQSATIAVEYRGLISLLGTDVKIIIKGCIGF